MNDLNEITARLARVARETLPLDILNRSGRVLYTPVETLVSGSPVYFLGANPGERPGTKVSHGLTTVEDDIERLETHSIVKHAYLEESWKGRPVGQAVIQKRAREVFAILANSNQRVGEELLRCTPISNLIFPRSKDVAVLKKATHIKTGELALLCWPFHSALIEAVKPLMVLTHSVSVARPLARKLGLGPGARRPSGMGGTISTLYAWRLPEGPMLLAIPNLSRYSPGGPREPSLRAFFEEFASEVMSVFRHASR